jgi:hypothetical protein
MFIIHDVDSNIPHNNHHKHHLRKKKHHHSELDREFDNKINSKLVSKNDDYAAPMNENYDWTFPILDKSISHNFGNFTSISFYLYFHLYIFLSMYLTIYISLYLYIYLSIYLYI